MHKVTMALLFIAGLSINLSAQIDMPDSLNWRSLNVGMYSSEINGINLPDWAYSIVEERSINKEYKLSFRLNPYFYYGYFNPDNNLDIAIWIENRRTGEHGLLIVLGGMNQPFILGGGLSQSEEPKDLRFVTNWKLVGNTIDEEGIFPPPKINKLLIIKIESSSATISWAETNFKWEWLAD